MNKTRPLSFLQLQKFEKTKWACFIHFWPLGRDMAIFSFFPQFNYCPFFLRHPLPLLSQTTQMCYVETDQKFNLPAPQGLPGGNGH